MRLSMKNIYHYLSLIFSSVVFLMAALNSIIYLFFKDKRYPLGQSFLNDKNYSILSIIYLVIILILTIISIALNIKYLKTGGYKNQALAVTVGLLIIIVIPLLITIIKLIFFTN